MTEHAPPAFTSAVDALMDEAEAATAEIRDLRRRLEEAEHRRRKLIAAVDTATQALPRGLRQEHARRIATLAEEIRPPRGRTPDTRLGAVVERLAALAHHGVLDLRVIDMQEHLERVGFTGLPPGYASNALARLAERGLVTKLSYGRYRIHDVHPELLPIRMRMLDEVMAEVKAQDREVEAARRAGWEKGIRQRP